MNYRHACVIDTRGYYQNFVQIRAEQNEAGEMEDKIYQYVLKTGESLLEVSPPGSFVRARWNGKAWEEGATQAEIEAWQQENPAPPEPVPTEEQVRLAALETQVTDTQMALAETYEQADMQNTDVLMATAEVYEKLLTLEGRLAALEGGANGNG